MPALSIQSFQRTFLPPLWRTAWAGKCPIQPSWHFVSETLLSPRPYKTPSPAKRTAPKVSFAGSSGKLGVSKSRLARLMKQRKINAPRCEGLSVRAVRDISPAQSLGQPAL